VIVEFALGLDADRLEPDAFRVPGRTICNLAVHGRFLVIDLDPADAGASTIVEDGNGPGARVYRRVPPVSVEWAGQTRLAEGEINRVTDDFVERTYNDPKTGESLRYSLFVPTGYESDRRYPLVVFLHDRGVCSQSDRLGLVQGWGGVIWATEGEQAKHPSLVLVPHYERAIVNDKHETTIHFEITVDLIAAISHLYSVDRSRTYCAGQSMGCMSLLEMNARYPRIFAAGLLCAGQWDADRVALLGAKNLWIVVSEGDDRAFQGMNAGVEALERGGATVRREIWDGTACPEEFAARVRHMAEGGGAFRYVVFRKGTVVSPSARFPEGFPDMLKNHMSTWRLVFGIAALRDWLFEQKKAEP